MHQVEQYAKFVRTKETNKHDANNDSHVFRRVLRHVRLVDSSFAVKHVDFLVFVEQHVDDVGEHADRQHESDVLVADEDESVDSEVAELSCVRHVGVE